ncbi:ion transport peptide-like [Penaeus indicus]|uniref:ion transport peptide-like n=1 Tax=Penaeus indicus TaxID=29960 RepID=UPI00300CD6DD
MAPERYKSEPLVEQRGSQPCCAAAGGSSAVPGVPNLGYNSRGESESMTESSGSFIKLRPNTLREFQFLQCRGDYDKERYTALSRVCDDCHNLFRQPQVMTECKSNCFRNSLFLTCVNLLKLEHLEDDFKNNIMIVSGNEL